MRAFLVRLSFQDLSLSTIKSKKIIKLDLIIEIAQVGLDFEPLDAQVGAGLVVGRPILPQLRRARASKAKVLRPPYFNRLLKGHATNAVGASPKLGACTA